MAIVDASVAFTWVAPDSKPGHPALLALDRLMEQGEELDAPWIMRAEVFNSLLTGIRGERWSGSAADHAQLLLDDFPVEYCDLPVDLDRAWNLSRRFDDHPVSDLVYVAMAERLETAFVTADANLRRKLVGLDYLISPEELIA